MVSVLLIAVALVLGIKDTFGLPGHYVFRAALLAGGFVLAIVQISLNFPRLRISRIWPVLGYLTVLLISSAASSAPLIAMAQVGALSSVILLGIAVGTMRPEPQVKATRRLLTSTTLIYLSASIGSLALLAVAPSSAFEVEFVGATRRFRGLFSEPAMMSSAAAILLGLSLFHIRTNVYRIFAFSVAAIGLALPMSRTAWVACAISVAATYLLAGRVTPRVLLALIVTTITGGAVFVASEIQVNEEAINDVVRIESLQSLSGRTELWASALVATETSPYIGNGFTLGASALTGVSRANVGEYVSEISAGRRRGSMHSGYVQSLLDSGYIGTVLYIVVIFSSLFFARTQTYDETGRSLIFIAIFGAVSNFGTNAIYSASVLDSCLIWFTLSVLLTRRAAASRVKSGLAKAVSSPTGVKSPRRGTKIPTLTSHGA